MAADADGGTVDFDGSFFYDPAGAAVLTATVTRYNTANPWGITSEFSNCIPISPPDLSHQAVTARDAWLTIRAFANPAIPDGVPLSMVSHAPLVSWSGAGPAPALAPALKAQEKG